MSEGERQGVWWAKKARSKAGALAGGIAKTAIIDAGDVWPYLPKYSCRHQAYGLGPEWRYKRLWRLLSLHRTDSSIKLIEKRCFF